MDYLCSDLPEIIQKSEFISDYISEYENDSISLNSDIVEIHNKVITIENITTLMESIRFFGIEDENINDMIFDLIFIDECSKRKTLNVKNIEGENFLDYVKNFTNYEMYLNEFPIEEIIRSSFEPNDFEAIKNERLFYLKYLLKRKHFSKNSILTAAGLGKLKSLKFFYENGFDIKDVIYNSEKSKSLECVKYGYDNGDREKLEFFFERSVITNNLDFVKFAFENNFKQYIFGLELLPTLASKHNTSEIFEFLLKNNLNIDIGTVYKCCENTNPKFCELLIEYGYNSSNVVNSLTKKYIYSGNFEKLTDIFSNFYFEYSPIFFSGIINKFGKKGLEFMISKNIEINITYIKFIIETNNIEKLKYFSKLSYVFTPLFFNCLSNTLVEDETLLVLKGFCESEEDVVLKILERNDIIILRRYIKLGFKYNVERIIVACCKNLSIHNVTCEFIKTLDLDINEIVRKLVNDCKITNYSADIFLCYFDDDFSEIIEPDDEE
jgi:hypothetical protein